MTDEASWVPPRAESRGAATEYGAWVRDRAAALADGMRVGELHGELIVAFDPGVTLRLRELITDLSADQLRLALTAALVDLAVLRVRDRD